MPFFDQPKLQLAELAPPASAAYLLTVARFEFWKDVLVEDPLFGRRAQFHQFFSTTSLTIHPHNRLGARKAVAYPSTVFTDQLEPIRAHFVHFAAEEVPGILLQLLSELRFDFRRQAKVFSLGIKGTNFDK